MSSGDLPIDPGDSPTGADAPSPCDGLPPSLTLAEKVDLLFRTSHSRGGSEYSYEEVAKQIAEGGGPTISATYLWMLRKGIRDNPTKRHLEALANFFKVSPEYFFDSETAQRYAAQLDLLQAFRDAGVREVALRAQDLPPETLRSIVQMLDNMRKLAGLPGAREDTEQPGASQSTLFDPSKSS